MVAKAFSIEDGNLSNKTLIGARTRSYSDIDLTFSKKPSGDIFKKNEAAAVKQAVKNLLMTNRLEKPFTIDYGGHLNDFLFELSTVVCASFFFAPEIVNPSSCSKFFIEFIISISLC